jgi:hypothetical protein
MRFIYPIIVVVAVTAFSETCFAAVSVYTNKTSWQAAVGP